MSSFVVRLAAAMLVVDASVTVAQTTPVAWSALVDRPRLLDARAAAGVHYPDMMRSAKVGGEVALELVVGSDGAPIPSTVRVVTSSHDLFATAARIAVREWRFSPPVVDGQPVSIVIPVRVSFLSPRDREPSRDVSSVVTDSLGVHVVLGRETLPRQDRVVASRADARAVTIAALTVLLKTAHGMKAGAVCVSWSDSSRQAPADLMASLRAVDDGIRNASRCPPTYASMILHIDSLGNPVKPPTSVPDPAWIGVWRVSPWTTDVYVMDGSISQGTAASLNFCTAKRSGRGSPWIAECELTGMRVS
jgi:TonB family protein